jgi:hypothetical protein
MPVADKLTGGKAKPKIKRHWQPPSLSDETGGIHRATHKTNVFHDEAHQSHSSIFAPSDGS